MICPSCQSTNTVHNETFDFWACLQCTNVWSTGENDPDHDDDTTQAQDAIADRNIEAIRQLFLDD